MSNLCESLSFIQNYKSQAANAVRPPMGLHQNRAMANNLQGIQLFTYRFADWQTQIIKALRQNNSIYVVAAPGAGKTAPVVYSWAENTLQINPSMQNNMGNNSIQYYYNLINRIKLILTESDQIPTVIYSVPTRTLCDQIYSEICEILYQVLFEALSMIQQYESLEKINSKKKHTNKDINPFDAVMKFITRNIKINIEGQINRRNGLYKQYDHLKTQFDTTQNKYIEQSMYRITDEIKQLDRIVLDQLSNGIKKYVDKVLVQRANAVYTPTNINNSLFVISVHDTAYEKVFKNINHIDSIIIDEAHTIQSDPDNSQDNAETSAKNIYKMFNEKNKDTNVILLSGTINPISAKNFINFVNANMGFEIKILKSNEGNASKITVLANDGINDNNTLINLLINPKENSNLIILFNKKLIIQLIEKAIKLSSGNVYSAKDINNGVIQQKSFSAMPTSSFRRTNNKVSQNLKINSGYMIKKAKEMPGAERISNSILRTAVLHGFGYVFRMDEPGMSKSELKQGTLDQQIVVNLFSSGKIRTILATDAVGIGLNIKVKNMYIPSIFKFDGQEMKKLGAANASQLYNRVGRRAFDVSTIHTPAEHVDDVIYAISIGNEQFDHRDVVDFNDTTILNQITKMNTFEKLFMMFSIFRPAIGYGMNLI